MASDNVDKSSHPRSTATSIESSTASTASPAATIKQHHAHHRLHNTSCDGSPMGRNSLAHALRQRLHRSALDKPQAHALSLPHTITERHGGSDLWVTAPVLGDRLEKQGFRWRKKWKTRYVQLNGRMLSYYEVSPTDDTHGSKPRQTVHITANAELAELDERTFSLVPNPGEKAWVFRARDTRTKHKWCRALQDCIDILNWLQHYDLGDVLGVGGNGVVRTLVDKRNGHKYAVKIVDASKFKNRAAAVSEVEILRNITNDIRHPNLVQIHKVYEEDEKIYMILDLCEGGELYDAIVRRGRYGESDAAHIMQQLMSAVEALHQHNILHLDLKPENILLSSKDPLDARIVLTDFGLARMIHGTDNPLEAGKTMAGTIGYIAPEVIAAHQYSEAADVFSAGVILFILLVGYPPFHGDSEVEILLKIARGDFQFHAEDWSHVSMAAKELVARMLEVRAQDRITVKEVLEHPWMRQHGSGDRNRELPHTVQRMQQFNFLRKSENMAGCMANMLADVSEADYLALVNAKAIDLLIRQLSPSGDNRMQIGKALVIARHLGLSPYVDIHQFVRFLDVNKDGFIDAQDFCEAVKAMRDGHESFGKIIFGALLDMAYGKSPASAPPGLTVADMQSAFVKLQCPEPLSNDFARYMTEHPEEWSDGDDTEPLPYIDEVSFVRIFQKFRFIGNLFLMKAKNNVIVIARTESSSDLAQIAEEIRESLHLNR